MFLFWKVGDWCWDSIVEGGGRVCGKFGRGVSGCGLVGCSSVSGVCSGVR